MSNNISFMVSEYYESDDDDSRYTLASESEESEHPEEEETMELEYDGQEAYYENEDDEYYYEEVDQAVETEKTIFPKPEIDYNKKASWSDTTKPQVTSLMDIIKEQEKNREIEEKNKKEEIPRVRNRPTFNFSKNQHRVRFFSPNEQNSTSIGKKKYMKRDRKF